MDQNVVTANREQDLWLTDETHVYFAPQGWCDAWSVAAGFTGGLDFIDDYGKPDPEIYCYAPIEDVPNSEVDTLFIPVRELQAMREIDETEAKQLHPALFDFLSHVAGGEGEHG